jgi:uncharacterized protein (TIGR00297 family)
MNAPLPRRSGGAVKAPYSETARQAVHMAMGGFALLLRWLPWWQTVAIAGAALGFNLFLLPRLRVNLYRPGDLDRGVHGIIWYPLAVLLLLVTFPRRPDIVAAAWGILAIGDGAATLAGRALGGPRWPWNREKTLSGSAAFAIGGAAAGIFFAWWCRPALPVPPAAAFTIAAPILAAAAAAFVETIPVRLDDNLSVAVTAGAVMWLASLASLAQLPAATALVAARLPAALALNVLVAWLGYRARTVSVAGATAGALIGLAIFLSLGWQGWTLLLITFLAASSASRLGLQRKILLGIAEARGGRRGPGNAIANTGVAALAAIVVLVGTAGTTARLAFAAALVAGGSDTIASEIGKAWGRRTWSITSLKHVPPGTSGAMSLEGTLAGIAGALGLGAAALALGLVQSVWLPAIVIGATAGSLLESWLGATLEAPGILNNDMLNFVNTAAAVLVTLAVAAPGS